jgi:hypothetical protein
MLRFAYPAVKFPNDLKPELQGAKESTEKNRESSAFLLLLWQKPIRNIHAPFQPFMP